MANNAIEVDVVGVNGSERSPFTFAFQCENVWVSEDTQSVTGANCTVMVLASNAGGARTNYQVTQTMTQVLDLINENVVADLVVADTLTINGYIVNSLATGLSAFAGGGQGSATALTKDYNIVATVATAADSVKLPTAVVGRVVTIKNTAANAMDVYPFSGDAINGGSANASISVPANVAKTFIADTTGNWETTTESVSVATLYADTITEKTSGAGIIMAKPIIRKAGTAKAVNTTGAITAAELAGGYITSTSAAAVTATLPTAALLATQLGAAAGTVFEFVVNNAAGANTVTMAVNTGIVTSSAVTGGDTLTVAASATVGIACFRITFISTTAAILSRIA